MGGRSHRGLEVELGGEPTLGLGECMVAGRGGGCGSRAGDMQGPSVTDCGVDGAA